MRIDVFFAPPQLGAADVGGRVVAVIDVLRASTTIAVALSNGARAVLPFDSADEALTRARSLERADTRLAGERKMLPIPGFDLGNSPAEFTREAVEGKTILLTTTNGTVSLAAVQGARDVVVASYVNFSAVLAMLRAAARSGTDLAIVCAGRDRHFSLEDAACAGRYVRNIVKRVPDTQVNDAARACSMIDRRYGEDLARLFQDAEHGKALVAAGFADDISLCASLDAYPVVPVYSDRQITRLGTDRGR